MPEAARLRWELSFVGGKGERTYSVAVQEHIPHVGWVTQASFTSGTIVGATGQARDYSDSQYPENNPPDPV
jgi:hypothetical protein